MTRQYVVVDVSRVCFFSSRYTCDPGGSLAKYTVDIAGKSYECYSTGQIVVVYERLDSHIITGPLVCAAYEDVCLVNPAD